jgi:hypothetical protein
VEPKSYPYILHNSKWSSYLLLPFVIEVLLVATFGAIANRTGIGPVLGSWFVGGFFIWLCIAAIADKKPALQLGREELWTPKLGFASWQQVVLKFDRVYGGKGGSFEVLRILDKHTQRQLDVVVLTSLEQSTSDVKKILQSCKRAQIV